MEIEEERKSCVTFSMTKKIMDDFQEHCELSYEDHNRLMEILITEYLEKQVQ